jgi:hypothetical protein
LGVPGAPLKLCTRCHIPKPESSFERFPSGNLRGVCHRCRLGKPPLDEQPPRFTRPLRAKRYLITAAQNATPVHAGFWRTLERAAAHLGAELVVVPLRYRNPTSQWTKTQDADDWWAPEVVPHLFNTRARLNANLVLAADVKTQPTASAPLTGFESLTGAESCIIAHTKMQLRVVPVPTGRTPKILSTTGACTRPNYSETKAGAIGAFHHYLGALLVELDGKRFHLRQLNADRKSGAFIDLDTEYTPDGARPAPPATGLVLGDSHARFMCLRVDAATFGRGGIVETLQPETLVFHDVFDGYSANPHHLGNPFVAAAKGALGDVRSEVEHTVGWIVERAQGRRAVLVDSNHGDFLARWVMRTDWRSDLRNAAFYLETAQAMLASARLGPGGSEYTDPWAYWVERLRGSADVRCLGPWESFKLADVECGMHGHLGPNGARGTLRNLARLGARVISGHSHTPGIEEGHYQCGTSTPLRLEYTRGPSSWLNTHCVVYANGKRALLTVVDGAWRA